MEKNVISNEALSDLCLGLAVQLDAGASTGSALNELAEESDKAYRSMLTGMAEQADLGNSLSDVMKETGRFPTYVCGLVKTSEDTGDTVNTLSKLAQYYEGRARLDRRIKSALLYPAVMLLLMLVVIGVLLVRVLPIFDDVYASLGGRLTGVAGGLLVLGRWLDGAMPVLWVLLAALVVFLAAFAAVPSFRGKLTSLWRNRWGDRGVSRKMNDARLAQVLAMGLAAGSEITIERAIELAAEVLEDVPRARARCLDCCERVNQADDVSTAMRESQLLPAAACRQFGLADRNGKGAERMEKIAADLLEESELALEEQVNRVEPALVLVCSILVGLILLSVMLPLMHIMSAIG